MPPTALEPGSRVGPYRIERHLGEGAVGIVFDAIREPDGHRVALKFLRPELSTDDVYRQRFVHEARAAGEVHAKHLVPIEDAGEIDGRSYLAVTFVDGVSLDHHLEGRGALPMPEAVRVVTHVASALDALHRAGIVHRDVKPSNVMLDGRGAAWLTDFGLAKGRAYTVLTRPGMVMGTLDYLAPELFRGTEATPASDRYALGCLAYECVAGRAPFADRSMFDLAKAHLSEMPEDPTLGREDATPGVWLAIRRELAKAPEDRPPTATAFATLLSFGAGTASPSS